MWSLTVKLMKKSSKMLIPAGIAILIGTAFIACTFLFGNTLNDSLRSQTTASLGQSDYVITVETPDDTSYDHTVADFHLDDIRAIEGVQGVRADQQMGVQLSYGNKHVSSIGISTSKDSRLLPVVVSSGAQPDGDDQIALPQQAAKQLHASIGDTISVKTASQTQDTAQQVQVVGLTQDPNGAFSYYGGAAVLSDNVIAGGGASDFNQMNVYQLFLSIDADHADAALSAIKRNLPKTFGVESRQEVADAALDSLGTGGVSPVTIFLMVFGVIAMFVAALVIANTFQVLVAQRRRTFALLRTIGAKKGQIYRSVILEATLLGLISSALGSAAGIAIMAVVIKGGLLNQTAANARLIISVPVIAVPLIFGTAVTLFASLGSARSATKVTPLEALRPMELTDTKKAGRFRFIVGALMGVVGLALVIFSALHMHEYIQTGLTVNSDTAYSTVLSMAILGCLLIFLGLALTATFWLPKLMKGVGKLIAFSGPSAKVANANVQKNPRRVAATGLALMIGVTLVSTIVTGAASGKATMGNALDTRYSVDLIAYGDQLSQQSADKVASTKGIEQTVYAPTETGYLTDAQGKNVTVMLIGVDGTSQLSKVMHADISGVSINGHTILVPKYSAKSGKELKFSDMSSFEEVYDWANYDDEGNVISDPSSKQDFTIQQRDFRRISDSYDAVAFVNISNFNDGSLHASSHILLASTTDQGSTLADTFEHVQSTLSSDIGVIVAGPIAERSQWEQVINSMMALLVGLLAVAVLIALIGVANTLSLSVIERTRESATLRAIGMTRGQLRRSLSVEALLIALVSGVSGIVLGTLFGWLGSYIVFSMLGTIVLPFEWVTNGLVLLVAALAALMASVFPARRALRTPPVEALSEA